MNQTNPHFFNGKQTNELLQILTGDLKLEWPELRSSLNGNQTRSFNHFTFEKESKRSRVLNVISKAIKVGEHEFPIDPKITKEFEGESFSKDVYILTDKNTGTKVRFQQLSHVLKKDNDNIRIPTDSFGVNVIEWNDITAEKKEKVNQVLAKTPQIRVSLVSEETTLSFVKNHMEKELRIRLGYNPAEFVQTVKPEPTILVDDQSHLIHPLIELSQDLKLPKQRLPRSSDGFGALEKFYMYALLEQAENGHFAMDSMLSSIQGDKDFKTQGKTYHNYTTDMISDLWKRGFVEEVKTKVGKPHYRLKNALTYEEDALNNYFNSFYLNKPELKNRLVKLYDETHDKTASLQQAQQTPAAAILPDKIVPKTHAVIWPNPRLLSIARNLMKAQGSSPELVVTQHNKFDMQLLGQSMSVKAHVTHLAFPGTDGCSIDIISSQNMAPVMLVTTTQTEQPTSPEAHKRFIQVARDFTENRVNRDVSPAAFFGYDPLGKPTSLNDRPKPDRYLDPLIKKLRRPKP